MRVLLVALLAAISYAQTERAPDPVWADLNIDTGDDYAGEHISCNRRQWAAEGLVGGDSDWCFRAREFRQYEAKNGQNGECTTEFCKAFDGVESAERCHDIVQQSDNCGEKWGFSWRRWDGRCWAKSADYSSVVENSDVYVSGPVDRDLECLSGCRDKYSKSDCKNIRKSDMCPYYYNYCRKTCGCDYDYWSERTNAGIDDAAVYAASNSNDCVDDFVDSQGFGCNVYDAAGWCSRDDVFDEVVDSEGWCKRFPRESWYNTQDRVKPNQDAQMCRVRRGRHRWGPFEAYRDANGMDARACCCSGEKYALYQHDGESLDDFFQGWDASDSDGRCMDRLHEDDGLPWHDNNGWSCRVYAEANLCTSDGSKGAGWNNDWGSIQANAYHDGTDARQACCVCGGGYDHPQYDEIPGVLLRRLDNHISGTGYSNMAWRKTMKFTRVLVSGQNSEEKRYDPEMYDYFQRMYMIVKTNKIINQQSWDEMVAIWDDLRNHYPEYNWLHN